MIAPGKKPERAMNRETVSCEVRDHIALVTMNNPPVNAQNRQFHEDMMAVFDEISDRPEIRVAILTGAGKCFSAGADIKGRAGRQMAAGESWGHNRRARECRSEEHTSELPSLMRISYAVFCLQKQTQN